MDMDRTEPFDQKKHGKMVHLIIIKQDNKLTVNVVNVFDFIFLCIFPQLCSFYFQDDLDLLLKLLITHFPARNAAKIKI